MKHFLLETLSFPSFLPASSDIPSSLLLLGFLFLMKVAQSCPTLCNPMNYSVHGISQARILEWVVFLFSRESSQPRDQTQVSHIAGRFFTSWATREVSKQWSGQPIPSSADLPDPGIEPGSPLLQGILYQLSYQGNPILFLVQLLSHVQFFVTPWTVACQASLSIRTLGVYSNSCPLSRWCHPTISFSITPFSAFNLFQSQGFSNESVLCVRWPKYWNFGFSIYPSNEYAGLISFSNDWFDLFVIQVTLKSVIQHHSSKYINSLVPSFLYGPTLTSILEESTAAHSSILAWRIPWTEEPGGLQSMRSQGVGYDPATKHLTYMTTGKTIALTRWTSVGKVMSLLFNMLSRLV